MPHGPQPQEKFVLQLSTTEQENQSIRPENTEITVSIILEKQMSEENRQSDNYSRHSDSQAGKDKRGFMIWSFVWSAGSALCWVFHSSVEGRQALTGPPEDSSFPWIIMDVAVGLRRGIIVFGVLGLYYGIRAVIKRKKALDWAALIIALGLCSAGFYIMAQMGFSGFWLDN